MKAGHWVYLIDGCEMSWTPSTWDAHQATQVPCGPFCSSWAFAASSTCRHQQPLRCKGKGMPHLPLSMLGLSWSIHVYSHVYIQIYIHIHCCSINLLCSQRCVHTFTPRKLPSQASINLVRSWGEPAADWFPAFDAAGESFGNQQELLRRETTSQMVGAKKKNAAGDLVKHGQSAEDPAVGPILGWSSAQSEER
jgi:hypothetical protein